MYGARALSTYHYYHYYYSFQSSIKRREKKKNIIYNIIIFNRIKLNAPGKCIIILNLNMYVCCFLHHFRVVKFWIFMKSCHCHCHSNIEGTAANKNFGILCWLIWLEVICPQKWLAHNWQRLFDYGWVSLDETCVVMLTMNEIYHCNNIDISHSITCIQYTVYNMTK